MDLLALREELRGIDLASGVLLKDFVVDEAHGGLDVLKHETVEIAGAFGHCGVLGVCGCEIGDFLECGGMKEDDKAVGGPSLDGFGSEG